MSAPDYHNLVTPRETIIVRASNSSGNEHPYSANGIAATNMDQLASALRTGVELLRKWRAGDKEKGDPVEAIGAIPGVKVEGDVVSLIMALNALQLRETDPYAGIGVKFETNAATLGDMEIKNDARAADVTKILRSMLADLKVESDEMDPETLKGRQELLFITTYKVQRRLGEDRSMGKYYDTCESIITELTPALGLSRMHNLVVELRKQDEEAEKARLGRYTASRSGGGGGH